MPIYAYEGRVPRFDPKTSWVAPGAHVIGDVHLASDVSVWFGAVIRGDNEAIRVGKGTNVQENAVVHTDKGLELKIGVNCVIGHGAIVHGCTIGDNVLIGMGATILNRADIGDNCIVGAGALITEGTVIPPNSLVLGTPGKVKRETSPEEHERIRSTAQLYVDKWKAFRAGLSELD